MRWAPFRAFLERRERRGLPVPGGDPPELLEDLERVRAWWQQLHAGRTWGFGTPNPIAVSEIVALLDLLGVDDHDERAEALVLIRELDQVWLGHVAEKAREDDKRDPRHRKAPRDRGGR